MAPVNMHEAKSRLSALVEAVESGREAEVVIARNGKPAARLVPIDRADRRPIFGLAKGEFTLPDDWERIDAEMDAEIERMFLGEDDGEADAR